MSSKPSALSKLIYLTIIICILLAAGSGLYYWLVIRENPIAMHIDESNIYILEGKMVKEKEQRNINYILLEEMPDHLINAFIAMEDTRFFNHRGVDYIGIVRAVVVNISNLEIRQGGSTITQQLARNLFLDHYQTLDRKLTEIRIALALEHRYTKEEILEMYLNQIYFGHGNWGISQAAGAYFNSEVTELDLGESAVLAGIIQAPNAFAPVSSWDQAENRQKLVLDRMLELQLITREESEAAIRETANW